MSANTLRIDLPASVDLGQARFALAVGLICQGGGAISVNEAAALAGMERRAFIDAMVALGPEMAEMIEDAIDGDSFLEAKAEMEREGLEPIPLEQLFGECVKTSHQSSSGSHDVS